jgi:hypothetical protein
VVLGDVPLPRDRGRLVVGETVLESVELLAPWRLRTSAAFAALQYADRLNFTVHYDPRVLQHVAAAGLLEAFVAQVRSSLQALSPTPQRAVVLALPEAAAPCLDVATGR